MSRQTYQRIARLYDLLDLPFEYGRYRPLRTQLFAGLSGRILDAGVGTGRNMAFYPPGAEVVGIDLSPAMLARARRRRDRLGVPVGLAEMDIRALAFGDGAFDSVVATFLFCVLPNADQAQGLEEIRRVLRPGGEARLLEYVWSEDPRRRAVMRLWAPWVRWAYGAGFDRETARYAQSAGFRSIEQRFLVADIVKLIRLRR